jgi:hypothetical protein
VEHHKADVRQVDRGASGDDAARFLRELRQLRDGAGLGQAELAARAHYPFDSIRAAEIGPELPDLPVLSAYVRGCGGTTEEWEERWRSLTRTPSLPVSDARQSGVSDAATAGARIGSTTPVGDGPDPSIIIAALSRVAEEMASPNPDAAPGSPAVSPVPDFPPPEVRPTASPMPPASPPSPAESGTGWDPLPKSGAGWDPIRVSSAWPVLQHTPTVAAGSAGDGGAPDLAPPWEAAPWGKDPLGTAASGTSSAANPAAARAGTPRRAAAGTNAGRSGRTAAAARGPVNSASRTAVVVLIVVLLCVLAVVLAIFV